MNSEIAPLHGLTFQQEIRMFTGLKGKVVGFNRGIRSYNILVKENMAIPVLFTRIIHPLNMLESPFEIPFEGKAKSGPDTVTVLGWDSETKEFIAEPDSSPHTIIRILLESLKSVSGKDFPPKEIPDVTAEFEGNKNKAEEHFYDCTNPLRIVKIKSERDGNWYKNSVKYPSMFDKISESDRSD